MDNPRITQLLSFLEIDPTDAFTLYSIAYEYRKTGDLPAALDYFQKLIKTDPEYTGTYYHLGKTLEELERKDEAEAAYRKGIEITERLRDYHASSELRTALNGLLGLDYEDEV